MVPEPADQRPAMARSSEVLPAPDAPTTSSESPSGTCPVSPYSAFLYTPDAPSGATL